MNFFTLTSLLAIIAPLFIGMLLLVKGKARKDSLIFSLACIASSTWGLGAYGFSTSNVQDEALFWMKIAHIGVIFTPVFFFHFVIQLIERYDKVTVAFVYGLAFMFLGMTFFLKDFIIARFEFNQFYFFSFDIHRNPAYLFFFISFYLILVLYTIFVLVQSFKGSFGARRNKLKYFVIGCVLGWLGPFGMFLKVFGLPVYPYSNIFLGIYPFIFSYAILRYRLLDIHLVFRKSMVYSLSAGILASLFVMLVFPMTKFMYDIAAVDSFVVNIFVALIIAFLFNPLKNKIQSLIDNNFYKKQYDYYPTIRKISRDLVSIFDLDDLFKYVGDTIMSNLGLKNIYILHAVQGGGYEVAYYKMRKEESDKKSSEDYDVNREGKKITVNSEIVKFYTKSDDILVKDELPGYENDLGLEIIERIKSDLVPFHGEAVVPVFNDRELILLIILSEKLSGDMFTNDDINLLSIISNQLAVSMKNTQLYKDKVHSERLASIGMMSATFAHEIRNPLTSLKTFAQLMPEKYNDEEFRVSFSKIVEGEIERIDGLINDLLDFSTEKKSSRSNNFNLVALVDETVDYVKDKIDFEKKNINIAKNFGSGVIEMSGDASSLKQAFINIITNGCQAMHGEGLLQVNIQTDSKKVDVAITDTGEGIHPDDISKIFDPFVTTKEMGIGLGLAISKRIVEDHKGSIKVMSQLSKGTTFTISLPVQN
ncbi:MAG: ATP-binding protein [Nitrospirota bacterium]